MSAEHPQHRDHLELCPDCAGLAVTRMARLDGVSSVRTDGPAGGGFVRPEGLATVYIGRVEPCPNNKLEAGRE